MLKRKCLLLNISETLENLIINYFNIRFHCLFSILPVMEDNIEQAEDTQISNNTNNNIPLFIKKLWKMVNDSDTENIISWNDIGDAFVIHDQMQFITKLLPHYFKHNNMSSFVRQLNFYIFHKVPNVRDEIQFAHTCFMKDVPEILPFIRRKNPVLKQKSVAHFKDQEVQDLLNDIKNLKTKHTLVDKELAMLKQENAALWSELNSLRLKYTKQSTIINMLIHFLITYIHSHQNAFKPNMQVSTGETNGKNIKIGPTLLEIGYKNKINENRANPYTVDEPGTSSSIMYSVKLPENVSEHKRPRKNTHSLEEMFAMEDQAYPSMKKPKKKPLTYSIKLPGNQKDQLGRPEIQRSLLEILKENERLCEEDSNQIFRELDAETESLSDINDHKTSLEDVASTQPTEDTAMYTISYPAEPTSPIIESIEDLESREVIPTKLENVNTGADTVMNQHSSIHVENNVSKEIPIRTKSGTMTYTISYPKVTTIDKNISNKTTNSLELPKKAVKPIVNIKPKFINIPRRNVKQSIANTNIKSVGIKTNLIKISPVQSPKQTTVAHNYTQNVGSQSTNPEGTLLELLKENEQFVERTETPLSILNILPESNMSRYLENSSTDQNIEDFYSDENIGTSYQENLNFKSVVKESGKNKINILENPKENLSSYIDNTQEEIDMLQDILNNLTSKDFSNILNTDIDLENEEIRQDAGTSNEYIKEHVGTCLKDLPDLENM